MPETVKIDDSTTSETTNVSGKICTVGRLITADEGMRIVAEAASWKGTPYSLIGALSKKGDGGDCSGTTNKIYIAAGFPYPYQSSKTMLNYIEKSNRFRLIDKENGETPQPGDMILWPGGHIAIYAGFKDGDPNHITEETNRSGKKYKSVNDMWTARYPGGPAYGPGRSDKFRPREKFYFYRYFILPGENGCK